MRRALLLVGLVLLFTLGSGFPRLLLSGLGASVFAANTYTVTNTNDSGPGSLRQAILDSNANLGTDSITFSIGSGLQTIAPNTYLPDITDPVVIDGSTQPGFAGSPIIELSGINISNVPNKGVLTITAGGTTVRRLIINHCANSGIYLLTGGGNHIEGNYVGTDSSGTAGTNSSSNLIAIQSSPNNVIGGTTPDARNVIAGGGFHGISVLGFSATGNLIQGNYIGTNASGSAALGNRLSGVNLSSSDNVVGGTTVGARNVIAANGKSGIALETDDTSGNLVQGNYLGTDVTGKLPLGNRDYGVSISGSSNNNVIGGASPGARNVISGNGRAGVSVAQNSSSTIGNVVQGNFIGVAADGSTPLGNSIEGIRLFGALNTTVGGTATGAGNTIAYNGQNASAPPSGIEVFGGHGNSIRGNSIYSNAGLGIDLDANGVTANDPLDTDGGGNLRQNLPLIASVMSDANQTTISGSLNSGRNMTYLIDFYSNAGCDPSGNGEGATPFATISVVTDANGDASFVETLPISLPSGRVITATAIDPVGNTSEFSTCDPSKAAGSIHFGGANKAIEDAGVARLTVIRSGGSFGILTINYATDNITALAGQDYTAASGTLTFNDGETSKTLDIPIFNDGVTEPEEYFAVVLSNPSIFDSMSLPYIAIVAIQDIGTVPVLSINSVSVTEGNSGTTDAVFTVSLSAVSGKTVTATYNTSQGTATSGVDFQAVSGTLTFTPLVTTRTISVPVLGDTLSEFNEQFNVVLSMPTNATTGNPGMGTIVDDDPPPFASINDVSVVEGNSGSVLAQFTITLSAPSNKSVCVQVATVDGNANAGSDYDPLGTGPSNPPVFVFFDNGATTGNVSVVVKGDTQVETDEVFFANLTPCSVDVAVGDGHGIGKILNDDVQSAPAISISDAAVSDGSGPANAVFNVTLSVPSTETVTVKYTTSGRTAIADADFQSASGTLTFAPGVTAQMITIPVVPDSLTEGNETFAVNLSEPSNASLSDVQALGTISDGPAVQAPSLSINDITVVEGNSGTASIDFTVTLSNPNGQQIEFQYAAAPGTAGQNIDYSNVFGSALFGPGQTARTISVPIIGDALDEFDETFFINLSNATNGATFADAQGTATILDNDPKPWLLVSNASVDEGNAGTTNAVFTLSLSEPSGKPSSVNFGTEGGTATSTIDFAPTSGTLSFNPGEITKTVTVTVIGDLFNEAEIDETFFIHLSNSVNVELRTFLMVGTIINYVAPTLQLAPGNFTLNENAGSAAITVNRLGSTLAAVTVDYETSDSLTIDKNCGDFIHIASSRCDYATSVGTLRIPAGTVSRQIVIPIVDDAYAEGDETFTITLKRATEATLGSRQTAPITIQDNESTTGANPLAAVPFFVRQHYIDFLGREPDPGGFSGWQNILNNCGITVAPPCDRIEVSSAFFRSEEFQTRGYFIYRFYPTIGKIPLYPEFMPDLARVSGFLSPQELESNKVAFTDEFMTRQEFRARYDALTTTTAYVDGLLQTVGLPSHPARASWINALTNQSKTRGQVLRELVESSEVYEKYYNEAFVIMQYFGYLRRSADISYQQWIQTMNQTNGDYRTMINGFLNSAEYRQRFGP